ncbi:tetratricopeptide repeat protein [Paenibacillus antri]|uniref:Tetratricopeptide repeat protein n=1 Tax=Paenibacillus antri TaxID=2582848 RepID=A0A5R9G8E0_9BACL|nr:tetratricopeptide repeat protein [Paenibacillus antri]TLS52677.1 tetratricopeptide repeat protein [Paenibacillus antri]
MSNDNARELIRSGSLKFRSGDYEQALKLFQQAARSDPDSAEAHAWLAAVHGRRIEAAVSMTEKIKLLSLLEDELAVALRLDSTLPLARRMNGAMLLNTPDMLGGDPAAAVDEFRYCIDRGMDDADIWVSLAECYAKTGFPEQAVEALETALKREPGHERATALLNRARGGSA